MTNCTFSDSTAAHGGDMFVGARNKPTVRNSTFKNNNTSIENLESLVLVNSILWGDGARIIGDTHVTKKNCVIQNGGSGVITQMQSAEYAQTVAAQIQSGALPMELTQQKVDTVNATLGSDALSTSVLAGIIGILLIMVVMIVRYRLNGVLASWALCIYVILLFFLLAIIPGIQLTLPGLAGIVLGIGMAVDANVIIFERFNEELRAGRGLRTALRTGFKNAMSAILDANVTTLIAAIVLMFYGTGSIQGFAKTLLLGVIASMFTAVVVTRFLMKNVINLGIKNKAMFAKVPAVEEDQK